MAKEFAIIVRIKNETVVEYIRGNINTAKKQADSTMHMLGADNYTIAELKETFFK